MGPGAVLAERVRSCLCVRSGCVCLQQNIGFYMTFVLAKQQSFFPGTGHDVFRSETNLTKFRISASVIPKKVEAFNLTTPVHLCSTFSF